MVGYFVIQTHFHFRIFCSSNMIKKDFVLIVFNVYLSIDLSIFFSAWLNSWF